MTRYVLNFYVIKDGVFLEESAARFIKVRSEAYP